MGKCVSKQPSVVNLTESDFIATTAAAAAKGIKRKYSDISDCTPICEQDENEHEQCSSSGGEESLHKDEGQSESKKSSKRAGAPETKGTAMSFGFRKKIHSANKKNANLFKGKEKEKEKEKELFKYQEKSGSGQTTPTVISNQEASEYIKDSPTDDANGNQGTESTSDNKQEVKRDALPPSVAKRETGGSALPAYKGSRFGFRASNIVRPASAGLTPRFTDFEENIENNNVTGLEKRRSKSATGTHRIQPASSSSAPTASQTNRFQSHQQQQQENSDAATKTAVPKIGSATTTASVTFSNRNQWFLHQERRNNMSDFHQNNSSGFGKPPIAGQYTVINTGMHTNVIVKPTPQTAVASVSRFTLHTTSLPKPQYPVPISLPSSRPVAMDSKNVKQVVNTSRKGFTGPREVSTDSGIGSLDTNYEYSLAAGNHSPSRRSRPQSRPRNLEMVFNSRHKFDVRDLDDTLSTDSIEPLALPKLPSVFSSDNQTVPLNGLVRSSISTSQEEGQDTTDSRKTSRSHSDAESIDEEKLYRDRSTSEKTTKNPSIKDYNISSKNSSPVSSRSSWCHAGESLAPKDCSSFSLSSSDDSKDNQNEKTTSKTLEEDISSMPMNAKPNNATLTATETRKINEINNQKIANERPKTLSNITETKFAEMAAAVSDILLDDETSPTDSLVSSTESDGIALKKEKAKKKQLEDSPEKDIDEISPEIELISSPKSPGTPTHASNSLSLSDAGRDFLIDDEIADQPALLFSDKADLIDANHMRHSLTDTPTLMESNSFKSSAQISKPKLPSLLALENSLRTPKSKRRSTLSKAESLDTLSPCESIASDDLMMDFETSSLDSVERLSHSIKSQSGSALNGIDDIQLFTELDAKSGDLIREWNNVLRIHRSSKDSISSQLPARATRLLNRSRLQQSTLSNTGSDSPRSIDSLPHKHLRSSLTGKDIVSSSDDLLFIDKSFRNAMIQDVQYFKKQLTRLRRILQDDEENLMRSETLNPFEQSNGKLFASCELDSSGQLATDDKDTSSLASSIADDPRQELADLRRQVVYLQGQLDDRDRTIRIQKNLLDKLESERSTASVATSISEKECVNTATQTDRVRPLSIGQEGLARSKPELASYTTHFPASNNGMTNDRAGRRHTVISTTLTNLNHIASACPNRRSSLSLEKLTYKPVKTTMIGEPVKEMSMKVLAATKDMPIEISSTKKLTNGLNRIHINGFQNGHSYPVQQPHHQHLTNGAAQKSMNNCHKTKESLFDDFKQDNRSQTITIV